MNPDLALIAAVLESRDFETAMREGASTAIVSGEAQIYFSVLQDHYEKFHEVPTVAYFQSLCPGYEHHVPGDTIPALVYELKTRTLWADIDEMVHLVAAKNQIDPWEARKLLAERMDRLAAAHQEGNTDMLLGSGKERVEKTIERLKNRGGLLGMPWPWEPFNKKSAGVVPGNFVYIYGRQKERKTFLLLMAALFYEQMNYRVLVFTREMSNEELEWRAYALKAQLDYGKLLKADLTPQEEAHLYKEIDGFEKRGLILFTEQTGGVAGLRAKIKEFRPHVVFHDYMKALADDAMGDSVRGTDEHRYVAKAADQIKKVAMDEKIAIWACGHANREGDKSKGRSGTEHAHSDHIVRKADVALRVVLDKRNQRMAIVVNAGRAIPDDFAITVNANLCQGFGTVMEEDASWLGSVDEVSEEEDKSKARMGTAAKPAVAMPQGPITAATFKRPFRRS